MLRITVRRFNWSAVNFMACLAGLLYNSWPLGFILNPVVARRNFASELESTHQPFAWLFITLDVLTGILLLLIGVVQWHKTARRKTIRLSIVAYVLFGVLVMAAALAPYNCVSGTQSCQPLLHSPAFLIHGFSSVVSVVFLLVSLVLPAKILIERRMRRGLLLMGVFIVGGWGLTGLGTLIVLAHGIRSNWLQYDFITVCSISIALAIILIERLGANSPVAMPADLQIDQDLWEYR